MSQPRRSAKIAARQAQNQPIPLDDDDTMDVPCCNDSTHRLCVDDGVDAIVRTVRWIFVKCLAEVIISVV